MSPVVTALCVGLVTVLWMGVVAAVWAAVSAGDEYPTERSGVVTEE